MAVVIGQAFGNFQVVRLLGEGGFGEVYEAQNPFLQRRAAVKVLHAGMGQDPELVRRFLNEARAASAIRHPNIVDVFDAGVTPDGEPYILMELLDGESLQKILGQQGRLDLATALEVARQAGSALAAAHLAGIVHRDLKPENLFLVDDAAAPLGFLVKVLDFGIAKVKHPEDRDATVRTQAGLLMGSPAYMSPEQCRDSSDVDHRTDIYSLAIIVYEMLTGTPPFSSKSAAEMLVMQMATAPPPLCECVADVPEHVEQAVARALAKDRDLRYDSVDYFVGALQGTHPAATAQGNAPSAPQAASDEIRVGALEGGPADDHLGPASTGPLSSRFGLTPAPAPVLAPTADPTITTLSRASGESRIHGDVDSQRQPSRRGIALAISAVLAAGAAILIGYRGVPGSLRLPAPPTPPPPAAPAMVHVHVRSSPPGAIVLDASRGSVLGITPFDSSFAQSPGALSLILRLDGYLEKPLTIGLDGNSSTSVDLQPVPPPQPEATNASAGVHKPSRKVSRPSPARSLVDKEEEWRVH